MDLKIEHDLEQKKFKAVVDGIESYISYKMQSPSVMDLEHTVVPKELGGRGYAAGLTRYVIDYAREHGLKIIPTCPYARAYFVKHPQVKNLLA